MEERRLLLTESELEADGWIKGEDLQVGDIITSVAIRPNRYYRYLDSSSTNTEPGTVTILGLAPNFVDYDSQIQQELIQNIDYVTCSQYTYQNYNGLKFNFSGYQDSVLFFLNGVKDKMLNQDQHIDLFFDAYVTLGLYNNYINLTPSTTLYVNIHPDIQYPSFWIDYFGSNETYRYIRVMMNGTRENGIGSINSLYNYINFTGDTLSNYFVQLEAGCFLRGGKTFGDYTIIQLEGASDTTSSNASFHTIYPNASGYWKYGVLTKGLIVKSIRNISNDTYFKILEQ